MASLLRLDVHLLSFTISYFQDDLPSILSLLSTCRSLHSNIVGDSALWIGWLNRLADLSPSERVNAIHFMYKYNRSEGKKEDEEFCAYTSFRSIRNNGVHFLDLLTRNHQSNDFYTEEFISLSNRSQFFILSILKALIMGSKHPLSNHSYKSVADCLLLPLYTDLLNRINLTTYERIHVQLCNEYQCVQWRNLIVKQEESPEECFYEDGLLIISRYHFRPELDSLTLLLHEMVLNVWKELSLLPKDCQYVAGKCLSF